MHSSHIVVSYIWGAREAALLKEAPLTYESLLSHPSKE